MFPPLVTIPLFSLLPPKFLTEAQTLPGGEIGLLPFSALVYFWLTIPMWKNACNLNKRKRKYPYCISDARFCICSFPECHPHRWHLSVQGWVGRFKPSIGGGGRGFARGKKFVQIPNLKKNIPISRITLFPILPAEFPSWSSYFPRRLGIWGTIGILQQF